VTLEHTVSAQLPVDLDLESLGAEDVGRLVDFRAAAALSAQAGGIFHLHAGVDLTDPEDPRPLLYDTSGLAFTLRAAATGIEFSTALGPLGVWIHQGSAVIDLDGNPATTEPAVLALDVIDNDSDGKIYFKDLDLDKALLSLVGQVHVVLPVSTPTESNYLGDIELRVRDLADPLDKTKTTLTAPDFKSTFGTFDLMNNLGVVVDGLDDLLEGVQRTLQSNVFSHRWPMIGNKLGQAAGFIEDLQTGMVANIRNRFMEARSRTSLVIQNALFDALGPDGLDILQDRDANGVTRDDITVSVRDTDGDGQSDDQVDVNLVLWKEATLVDAPIDFDIGLPALGLEVDGNVQLVLGFQWQLAFGVSRTHGVYFDTSPEKELVLYVAARTPDMHAEGSLLFFQLDVLDEDTDANPSNVGVDVDHDGVLPSTLALLVSVDLLDPFSDGKLTFGDLSKLDLLDPDDLSRLIDVTVEGNADVNLNVVLSYEGDARFPSLAADFALDWGFSPTDPDLYGSVPTIAFNNVRLNVGEFVSDFAMPILKKVRKFTEPVQPIVDFLTEPIPLVKQLGREMTPLDILRQFEDYRAVADYIEAVATVIDVINSIPIVGHGLYLPLGSFDLLGTDLRHAQDTSGATPRVTETVDPKTELARPENSPETASWLDDLPNGFSFPLVESPLSAFKLLMGQDVDLLTYAMPPLEFEVNVPEIVRIPIYPPYHVWAVIGARLEAKIDLKFGFDTHGFTKFRETGDWWDIFSGFYVSDRKNADGTGPDVPEGTLSGTIDVGAEVGSGAAVGVSGGVTLNLYANLDDTDDDGKIHVDEFLANLDLGLLSTFDVSGDITADLDMYVKAGQERVWECQIAEMKIAEFELTEEQIYHDRYSENEGQTTSTNVGVGPGIHVDGLSLESSSDVDWYEFKLIHPDSIDVDVRASDSRGNVDIEVYDATGTKLGESRTEKDREVVSLVDLPAGTYRARVSGSGQLNNYMFCVEPGETSSTRVHYVNPGGKEDRSDSFYTLEPGDDGHDGLSPRKPKATLQSVLDDYDLGPNDFVVFDTGYHAGNVNIGPEDGGATYVGALVGDDISATGSHVSDLTVNGSHNSEFYGLVFSGGGTGVTITGDAIGNLVHYCTFLDNGTGIRIDASLPNVIEHNSVAGGGEEEDLEGTGIYISAGATSTVRQNDVFHNATGIYCDSLVATFYDNDIRNNTVGMSSTCGALGPDNPAPFGAAGGLEPNRVFANQTGVLVPSDAMDVLVRFNLIYGNAEVGIEQLGERSQIIANDIYENPIGIRGTRVIGAADWGAELHNLIHNNEVGVWAEAGAEVRFNRIFENATGIRSNGDAIVDNNAIQRLIGRGVIVHHNLIYRNTGHGVLLDAPPLDPSPPPEVLLDGAHDVQIINNTIYSPSGDGVRLENSCSEIDIRNNIIWTSSGHALYVAARSQFGYTSDYNNLYTGGSGPVAFQGKNFYDLYDWQVEAESDLHSIGYTTVDPALDNPQFEDLGAGDFHLKQGSTSIDSGDPTSSFDLEPAPNGDRINLGAYGNTPDATVSPDYWLRITYPRYYVDLVPSRTYPIRWESYNIPGDTDLDIDLTLEDHTKVGDITTAHVGDGMTTWTPGNLVAGDRTLRYRIQATAAFGSAGGGAACASAVTESSREAFAIPNVDPAVANTFYVDDRDDTNDEYTSAAIGDNRNTGTSAEDPKVVIRPIVLSYALGPGDAVLVDTGGYIHAVNLNLSGQALAFDPRMNTVSDTLITGPTDHNKVAQIDRANSYSRAVAMDLIDSDNMTVNNLSITGAEMGVYVRQGSVNFVADHDHIFGHGLDGLAIEGGSDGAALDYLTVQYNGRHGIFVDSLLTHLTHSEASDNQQIGIALRSVGGTIVENCKSYRNQTGIDIINPGSAQAVVGHSDLTQNRGNIVHDNREDGIFASGNVLVGSNHVYDDARTGIRLDDGADAVWNVVRTHTTGISAQGSTSDVNDNRVCNNTETGIIASYASNVQRNVVYTNGQYGIHVDDFSGIIDHNLVYETGHTSIWVEGGAAGAQVINNTVYEPCAEEEPEKTTVTLTWEWTINMEQFEPLLNFPVFLAGTAEIQYDPPIPLGPPRDTFDLGAGGGIDALTPDPVPPGEWWQIDTEIVSLDLTSKEPTPLGPLEVHLSSLDRSQGHILVANDGGFLTGETLFDLSVVFVFPERGLTLFESGHMEVGRSFDFRDSLGDGQVLQAPLVLAASPSRVELGPTPPFPPPPPPPPWGTWGFNGGHALPAPPQQDPGRYGADIGIHVSTQSAYVLLRNNAVYVAGRPSPPPGLEGRDIVVEADSTTGWRSDFNIFTTSYGYTGQWAGADAPSMSVWQNLSGDDRFSIEPPWYKIWVDPDGGDNLLGFRSPGAGDGRDDNLHLRSPYGEVAQGAFAPVADPGTLPAMQTVVWQSDPPPPDPNKLSPGVDWGDPSYPFAAEPVENGKFINLGCYGDTAQASLSEPQYVHLVYPLGFEELVFGSTYEILWRSQGPLDPTEMVKIELRHGSATGAVEWVIANWTAPNSGPYPDTASYLWTVPAWPDPTQPPPFNPGTDYVIAISRGNHDPAPPDVIGASRFWFSISPVDTVAPKVIAATPQVVAYELPTNSPPSIITLTFSENLSAAAAGSPASYELRSAGPNGTFGDADDVLSPLGPVYTPGPADSDVSTVSLSIFAAPLPPGKYRLTAGLGLLTDAAGNALDGDGDGLPGGDYVRLFDVDQTPPTVSITSVGASPRKDPVSQISIVFSEAVRGLGLADLRLTRNGGRNLLADAHTLVTGDEITWVLGNLANLTAAPGSYLLQLTSSNQDIRDLAGNQLVTGASMSWSTETTPPTVEIQGVSPDPRGDPVSQIVLVFSEPVANFELADLTLSRDGGSNLLTASQVLSTNDSITWTVTDLSTLTAGDGTYTLTLGTTSGVTDLVGNPLAAGAREVWQKDTAAPEAGIVEVSPDPRHSAVGEIVIAFNEPVTGMDLNDLTLTRDGLGVPLTGSGPLSSLDGMNWTLGGLTDLTALAGQYVLTLTKAGSGIQDASGNLLAQDATDTWLVDTTPPTVAITAVNPDPHRTPVTSSTITFSEAVAGLDLADLVLTRNAGGNLLTTGQTLSTSDNVEWVLGNLGSLTALDGEYQLVLTAAGSGIEDAAGNPLVDSVTESWLMDGTAPSVDILAVTPDPRTTAVSQMTIIFSEPVQEFGLADLVLTCNEGGNLLPGSSATLTTADDITWTLGNLAGLTGTVGLYALALAAPGSQIADAAVNPLPCGDIEIWAYESSVLPLEAVAGVQFTKRAAAFCDPWSPGSPTGPEDFQAEVAWGDSSNSAGTVRILGGDPASFEVLATHTYARASAFRSVDADGGNGPLELVLTGYELTNPRALHLKATNSSSVETLRNVCFVQSFVWDAANAANKVAFAWNNAERCWTLGAKTYKTWGVLGQNSLMAMDRDMIDTPLSLTIPNGNAATVEVTDSLPAIGLGDFAPGQAKDFTLYISYPYAFLLEMGVYLVAARGPLECDVAVTLSKPSTGQSRVWTTTATVVTPAVRAWDGRTDDGTASTDADWQTAANWAGDAAPQAGDALLFLAGAARLAGANNYPAGTTFHSLALASGGYTIGGAEIGLSAGIVNKVTATAENVLDVGIRLDAPQTFQNLSGSTLVLGGPIDLNGNVLMIDGPGAVGFGGAISGNGRVEKKGTGTATLSGNNTYRGGTTVTEGTLVVSAVDALPLGGDLTIGAGAVVVLAGGLNSAPAGVSPLALRKDAALAERKPTIISTSIRTCAPGRPMPAGALLTDPHRPSSINAAATARATATPDSAWARKAKAHDAALRLPVSRSRGCPDISCGAGVSPAGSAAETAAPQQVLLGPLSDLARSHLVHGNHVFLAVAREVRNHKLIAELDLLADQVLAEPHGLERSGGRRGGFAGLAGP
jgi:autotransporter-associated beta strand protein